MTQRVEQVLYDEFSLNYQPRYQLQSSRLADVEALIRWQLQGGPTWNITKKRC